MHLWQLDLVGGVMLADGRECKMVTGIDDHSRFVVIATAVAVPTGRAVCEAFVAAMRCYGVPSEVLTDLCRSDVSRPCVQVEVDCPLWDATSCVIQGTSDRHDSITGRTVPTCVIRAADLPPPCGLPGTGGSRRAWRSG